MADIKTPNPEPGSKFHRWTVLSQTQNRKGNLYFLCRCDCGTEKTVYKSSLVNGLSKSCGCYRKELPGELHKNGHKKVGTKVYWVWADMVGRCTNKNHKCFADYGGRGITVDQSWRRFPNFYRDMGEPPKGYSLDRKNNNLGYNKDNCRWATAEEQANNKRNTVKHKIGESLLSLREVSNKYGIPIGALRRQVYVKKLSVSDLLKNQGTQKMNTKLVWATPEADKHLAYIARVSNPANQANQSIEGLLRYMEREGHVSPFTMCNMCVEVNTSRAIGRQILRHWSIAPQEFSQRYASVDALGEMIVLECRMQDVKDRQNSLECTDLTTAAWFAAAQSVNSADALALYNEALERGIAKELARCFLPEGNTPSRLYLNGNFRSWIHYLRSRLHPSTQKEHRQIAAEIAEIFEAVAPVTYKAFFGDAT